MTAFDPDRFRCVLKAAARAAFADLRSRHPDERFYAFALYTVSEAEYVVPTANTEEGLTRKAEEHARRAGDSPEARAADIRWSPADWAYHLEGEGRFGEVENLLAEVEPYDLDVDGAAYRERVHGVFETCLSVLEELDAEGLFGQGEERGRVVVNLLKGDQSDAEMLEWARRLNPRPVYERFAGEIG